MKERITYPKTIKFNDRLFTEIVIDQHYRNNHPDISDELILSILEKVVSGKTVDPEDEASERGFQYFKIQRLEFEDRWYRLILLTCEGESFLGVVNAFRVEKRK